MKVLILSPYPENLIRALERAGDTFEVHNNFLDVNYLKSNSIEFVVSYGYRAILSEEVINHIRECIVNLHISYLPFNKGCYPNLWSHIDGTPSGVTIHRIDEGIDSGEILFRKKVKINQENHTFESSYRGLKREIEDLFYEKWVDLRLNRCKGFLVEAQGTFHCRKEGEDVLSRLPLGWRTKISDALKIIKSQ